MSEGGNSPELPSGPTSRVPIRERLAKLIPNRFRHKQQPEITTAPASINEPVHPTVPEAIRDEAQDITKATEKIPAANTELQVFTQSNLSAKAKEGVEEIDPSKLTPNVDAEETIVLPSRVTGIATRFSQELRQRKLTIPEVKAEGVSAIIGTNEAVGAGFFEAVQARNPDGYLVGVGAGNAFTMLHCFQDGVIPAGVVLSDLDPMAVAIGKLLVNGLKEAESANDLQSKFFNIPEDKFKTSVQQLISEESDPILKAEWQKVDPEVWQKAWKQLGEREYFTWVQTRAYKNEGQNIDVVGAILNKFTTLKQLATEDNIAVEYADFTDPEFINSVLELPKFDEVTNIVYISNIVDHITHRGTNLSNLKYIRQLKAYGHQDKKPIYIDTLGQRLNYYLRARKSLADFTNEDFIYRGIQPRSKKPEDLLFPDAD